MSHSGREGRLVVDPKVSNPSLRSRARAVVGRGALWLETTPIGVLWSRLLEVEFVDRSVALAAKLLVSFFPLLVVAAALARDGVRQAIVSAVMERLGVSGPSLDMVQQAFASPDATRAATGILGVILTLAYAVSFTTALQRVYLKAWRRPSGGGVRNKGRGALWVGGMVVYIFVLATMRDLIGGSTGTVLTWTVSVLVGVLLWWWTAWLMLRGEVRWRPLLPTASVTGLGISMYALGADIWMPVTVSGNYAQFGAFGIALAFVTFFTGMAFVTVVGAVIGPVLAEADDRVGRWLRGGAATALDATAPPSLPGPDRPVRLADAFGRGARAPRPLRPDPDKTPEP